MAAGAVMFTFTGQLADVDRDEGIVFSEGVSSTEEPAVLVRDRTGRLTAWIEVGAPDAARLHHGSKLADRTSVYTHRDPVKVMSAWAGKRIHESDRIVLRSFDPGFIDAAVAAVERRNTLTVSRTEGQLYLDLNGVSLSSLIHDHALA